MDRKERAEKILELSKRNGDFKGKFADMQKAANYRYILNAISKEAEDDPKIIEVFDSPASASERWGYIYIDLPTTVYISGKLQKVIADCASRADSMVLASLPDCLRLSFGVDVWKE